MESEALAALLKVLAAAIAVIAAVLGLVRKLKSARPRVEVRHGFGFLTPDLRPCLKIDVANTGAQPVVIAAAGIGSEGGKRLQFVGASNERFPYQLAPGTSLTLVEDLAVLEGVQAHRLSRAYVETATGLWSYGPEGFALDLENFAAAALTAQLQATE